MVELSSPIQYHLCQESPLPPVSWLYDYVIAADGVYKRAENDYMSACIPVTELTTHVGIAGLGCCELPYFALKIPKLPVSALANIIGDACTHWSDYGRFIENYYIINKQGVALRPTQKGTAGSVSYEFGAIAMKNSHTYLMDIHTHPAEAFFSETDNADEQGFKMYGVLGNINLERPDFCLRLGVYGDFMTLRASEVFDEGIYDLIREVDL